MELTGSDWETNIARRGIELQMMRDTGMVKDSKSEDGREVSN
ncbi:MAG: hypothetical protein ACYC27_16680 [Armatimonadota bacterium]